MNEVAEDFELRTFDLMPDESVLLENVVSFTPGDKVILVGYYGRPEVLARMGSLSDRRTGSAHAERLRHPPLWPADQIHLGFNHLRLATIVDEVAALCVGISAMAPKEDRRA